MSSKLQRTQKKTFVTNLTYCHERGACHRNTLKQFPKKLTRKNVQRYRGVYLRQAEKSRKFFEKRDETNQAFSSFVERFKYIARILKSMVQSISYSLIHTQAQRYFLSLCKTPVGLVGTTGTKPSRPWPSCGLLISAILTFKLLNALARLIPSNVEPPTGTGKCGLSRVRLLTKPKMSGAKVCFLSQKEMTEATRSRAPAT